MNVDSCRSPPCNQSGGIIPIRSQEMLHRLGFHKGSMRLNVDTNQRHLTCDGEHVVTVSVVDRDLLEWGDAWGKWTELQNSSELCELISKSQETLRKSGGQKGKPERSRAVRNRA